MDKSEQNLLNKSARFCIQSLKQGSDASNDTQFWQTWAHLESIAFIMRSKLISENVKKVASQKGSNEWIKFNPNNKTPAVFTAFYKNVNTNYWDPNNTDIIWDDKLWLGNSYLALYSVFGANNYFETAKMLYQLCVEKNQDWRHQNYKGLEWKPKTNYRNSITNHLFFVLCARLYHITKQQIYWQATEVQYKFLFCQQGKYINNCGGKNIFPDGEGPNGFFTYNQGVPLQGLAYMLVYGKDKQRYMNDLVNLTNGMIEHFRDKSQPKLIMKQFSRGAYRSLRTGATFRAFVFRHLINVYYIITPQQWKQYRTRCPLLFTFILDNAQAMCKFQNTNPSYNWQLYDDHITYEYGVMNQFFVLLAAQQVFGIKEVTIDGLGFDSKGVIGVDLNNNNVDGIYLTTFSNHNGTYKKDSPKPLPIGANQFSRLLNGQILTNKNNTRNVLQIIVLLKNGKQVPFVLFHQQARNSQFSIISNITAQQLINNYVLRIREAKEIPQVGSQQGISAYLSHSDGYLFLAIQ